MSHNITNRDNMFTVREPAWHGLGNVLEDYPTIEQARAIAHPWEPETEPVYRQVITVGESGPEVSYEMVKGYDIVSRDDNHDVLGVAPETRGLIYNRDMYEIAESLEKESRNGRPLRLETGGSLKGGRKVWLLLRLDEPLRLPGDPSGTIAYFALQNAHDGSASFRGQATNVRIVCDNTAQMADLDSKARGTSFNYRHTSKVQERVEQAKTSLALWREGLTHFEELSLELIRTKISAEQRRDFVEAFHPYPQSLALISERTKNNIDQARRELVSIFDGPTSEGINGTAYGLVQGAIEWSQHYRGTRGKSANDRAENRFARAYLDQSDLTRVAMKIAMSV